MFSMREKDIIKTIGRKKVTIADIANKVVPLDVVDATITVSNSVRRIIKKCDHYKLEWTLGKKRVGNKIVIFKEKRC